MRLKGLLEPFENSVEFENILGSINNERYPIGIYGIAESGRVYTIDSIFENIDRSMVIVTQSDMEAKNIYEDLLLYTNDVHYFPAKEMVFYNIDAISGDLRWARLKVINEILKKKKKIIVTSIDAFSARYTPHKLFADYTMKFKESDEINLIEVSKKLIQSGYERVEMVEGKGQFALRGGILDVFPTCSAYPYRIELFGDEIDSIRTFNTESQRSIDKVKKIEMFPAKEIIITDETISLGKEKLKKEFDNISKSDTDSTRVEKLRNILNKNLESLEETSTFETIDSYLPYFCKETESLFDYLKDCLFIIDDVQRCEGKLDSTYLEFEENFTAFSQRGDIFPKQGELLISKEEVIESFKDKKVVFLDGLVKKNSWFSPYTTVNISERTLNNYQGQLDLLIDEISDKKNQGYKIVILSGTRARGERLVGTLRDRGIESSYKDTVENIQYGEVVITFGNQLHGFQYPEYKVCVISDKEVFGEAKKKIKKTK